ncbi:MAG: hypothetical protein GXO26_02040 [Crenarchaeota archaeon]|nr:hypothetical protein [Thermoproteota archaeon]
MSLVQVRPLSLDWNANNQFDIGDIVLQLKQLKMLNLPQPVEEAIGQSVIQSEMGMLTDTVSRNYVADLAYWENWALQAFKQALGNGDLNHNGKVDIGDLVLALQLANRIAQQVPRQYRSAVANLLRSVAQTVMQELLTKENLTPEEVANLVDTIAQKAGHFLSEYYMTAQTTPPEEVWKNISELWRRFRKYVL